MNLDLGMRLVSAGLVTREELGLALASVPSHGGALLAELVRKGVEEEAIAGFFVADGFGPVVGTAELAGAEVDARVPPQLAVDMLAVPLSDGGAGFRVAMADPSDVHALRELAHAAGGQVIPIVARISSLLTVLADRYPRELEVAELRRQDSDSIPPGTLPGIPPGIATAPLSPESSPGTAAPIDDDVVMPLTRITHPPKPELRQTKDGPGAPADADLGPEHRRPITAEFEVLPRAQGPRHRRQRRQTAGRGLRATMGAGSSEPEGPDATPDAIPTRRQRRRRSTADQERVVTKTIAPAPPEPPSVAPSTEKRSDGPPRQRITVDFAAPHLTPSSLEEAVLSSAEVGPEPRGGWGELSRVSAAEGLARRAARAEAILPRRLPGAAAEEHGHTTTGDALSPGVARALGTLRTAETRDAVCREGCRGLAPLGRCAVLLVLVKGVLEGREVAGGNLTQTGVRNLWIPATSRSLLKEVVDTGEPYLGPHGDTSADAVFRAALSSRGGDVLLMPVVLSGRTIAVVALDEPIMDGVVLLERAELITRAMAQAFKRLVLAAKR